MQTRGGRTIGGEDLLDAMKPKSHSGTAGWMATVLVVLGWVVQLLVLVPFQIHIPWQHPFSWSVRRSLSPARHLEFMTTDHHRVRGICLTTIYYQYHTTHCHAICRAGEGVRICQINLRCKLYPKPQKPTHSPSSHSVGSHKNWFIFYAQISVSKVPTYLPPPPVASSEEESQRDDDTGNPQSHVKCDQVLRMWRCFCVSLMGILLCVRWLSSQPTKQPLQKHNSTADADMVQLGTLE